MDKFKVFGGVMLFMLVGLGFAYVLTAGYLTYVTTGQAQQINWTILLENWQMVRNHHPRVWSAILVIFGFCVIGMLLLSSFVVSESLTRFGQTHWQSKAELKKNGFFQPLGKGFVLAKMGKPGSPTKFISSSRFPHCLVVAPTGRGKGTGFVIPNLLLFAGSAVVLDVKGENYEKTSRFRAGQGDKVWRFAPVDWERPTHRYNPLQRIANLKNPDQRQMELRKTANLFLQAEGDNARGLLEGGIDLFVACGIFAIERGTPTLGEIYRLSASGGDKNKQYLAYADQVESPAARLIFERMASTNERTLTSYLSLLMTSGLSAWDNPAIDRATEASDFDFKTFRRIPQTAYLVVPPDDIKPLSPLIRLFFADLIASLQAKEPEPDEPWPVMVLLDEFDRLGKMPIVAESIKTLRSYGGHLAIVTQTIPALDEIYGENTRLSLQGGAGVKVYMTPSEERTVKELSEAAGKTTKRVVSKSRQIGKGPFSGTNVSERTEETALLTEDLARRLDLDDIILVIDGQHPARAKRIKYYDDKVLSKLYQSQTGSYPMPDPRDRAILDLQRNADRDADALRRRVESLEAQLSTSGGGAGQGGALARPGRATRGLSSAPELVSTASFTTSAQVRPVEFTHSAEASKPGPQVPDEIPFVMRRRPAATAIIEQARLLEPTGENTASIEAISDDLAVAIGSQPA